MSRFRGTCTADASRLRAGAAATCVAASARYTLLPVDDIPIRCRRAGEQDAERARCELHWIRLYSSARGLQRFELYCGGIDCSRLPTLVCPTLQVDHATAWRVRSSVFHLFLDEKGSLAGLRRYLPRIHVVRVRQLVSSTCGTRQSTNTIFLRHQSLRHESTPHTRWTCLPYNVLPNNQRVIKISALITDKPRQAFTAFSTCLRSQPMPQALLIATRSNA